MTNKEAQKLGKLGGQKTKEKYGSDFYKEIGKKGLKKRWGKTRNPPVSTD